MNLTTEDHIVCFRESAKGRNTSLLVANDRCHQAWLPWVHRGWFSRNSLLRIWVNACHLRPMQLSLVPSNCILTNKQFIGSTNFHKNEQIGHCTTNQNSWIRWYTFRTGHSKEIAIASKVRYLAYSFPVTTGKQISTVRMPHELGSLWPLYHLSIQWEV